MDEPDIQSQLAALRVRLGETQNRADKLIAEIEARPFQKMCRDKGTTPAEVLAGIEAHLTAGQTAEARSSHRELLKGCEEHARRELGLPDPSLKSAARRAPRRLI